jgi:predicted lipase
LEYALRFMDSTIENKKGEEISLTIRHLYPELSDEHLREAEGNLRRYFAIALDIYEEQSSHSVDTFPASPTMKERSKSLKT